MHYYVYERLLELMTTQHKLSVFGKTARKCAGHACNSTPLCLPLSVLHQLHPSSLLLPSPDQTAVEGRVGVTQMGPTPHESAICCSLPGEAEEGVGILWVGHVSQWGSLELGCS